MSILQSDATNFSESLSNTLNTRLISFSGVKCDETFSIISSTKLISSYRKSSMLFFNKKGLTFYSKSPLLSKTSQLRGNLNNAELSESLIGGRIDRIYLSSCFISSSESCRIYCCCSSASYYLACSYCYLSNSASYYYYYYYCNYICYCNYYAFAYSSINVLC